MIKNINSPDSIYSYGKTLSKKYFEQDIRFDSISEYKGNSLIELSYVFYDQNYKILLVKDIITKNNKLNGD